MIGIGQYNIGGYILVSLYQNRQTGVIYYVNGRGKNREFVKPAGEGHVIVRGGLKQTISPSLPDLVLRNYNSKQLKTAR
jgi:hypothetical protein